MTSFPYYVVLSGVIHAWIKFLGTVAFEWMEFHINQDGWQLYKAQDFDSGVQRLSVLRFWQERLS